MRQRTLVWGFGVIGLLATSFVVACGGGGGSSTTAGTAGGNTGGGASGGGENNAETISYVTPSQVMATAAPSTDPFVYGSNFTGASVVQINGTPVSTFYQSSTELSTAAAHNAIGGLGVYSITVNGPTGLTNAVPFTVYAPTQGPQPFLALPGYYTGVEENPVAIAMGDLNGDGHEPDGRTNTEHFCCEQRRHGRDPAYLSAARNLWSRERQSRMVP